MTEISPPDPTSPENEKPKKPWYDQAFKFCGQVVDLAFERPGTKWLLLSIIGLNLFPIVHRHPDVLPALGRIAVTVIVFAGDRKSVV